MRQKQMMYQWMVSGARRLQTVVWHRGYVGVLAILVLLLRLMVAGQDTAAALVFSDSDEAVEALAATALREGDLDTSFSSDGKVTADFGHGSNDFASALILQPDNKIVVAGVSQANGTSAFALVRYRATGTLDPTFGTNGRVHTTVGNGQAEAHALVLQPDGKIVVAQPVTA